MNTKNKLLMSSALVASLVAAPSLSFAETKVGGDIEWVYTAKSAEGSSSKQTDSGDGFGTETNISLSHSKDLDNGLTLKYALTAEAEEGFSSDSELISIENGSGFAFQLGNDAGNSLDGDTVPYVGDSIDTVAGNVGRSDAQNAAASQTALSLQPQGNGHDTLHVSLNQKVADGTFTLRYAPSDTNDEGDDAAGTADAGGSITEVLYKGSFGVDGLKVIAGREIAKQADDSATTDDMTTDVIGLGYSFGQISVGATRFMKDDGAATNAETDMDTYGISFAASDSLSVGVFFANSDDEDQGTDEEVTMVQAGYNLGGLGIELSYVEIENTGYTAGEDNEGLVLRTRVKF